jgi:hypothetical protein
MSLLWRERANAPHVPHPEPSRRIKGLSVGKSKLAKVDVNFADKLFEFQREA